jgi:hypothetical protein
MTKDYETCPYGFGYTKDENGKWRLNETTQE